MIFQGSIRYSSGQKFSKVISSIRGGKKRLKILEYNKAKAELQGKCFVLGSCDSLRFGTEKGQSEHWRPTLEQSCAWADGNLGVSAKSNFHKWFSRNLANKETITAKQTLHSPT